MINSVQTFALFENLLSSCSGSFPPLSRRQKRLCKKASSDEDSLAFQSIPLARMISVGLDINQYIIHHNRWFPYNLVRAISVTNCIAGTIQSGKLSLNFKRTITITILNMINGHVQLFNCSLSTTCVSPISRAASFNAPNVSLNPPLTFG